MNKLTYENVEVTQSQLERIFELVGSKLTCLIAGSVGDKVRIVLQYRDETYQQRVKEILNAK